MKKITLSIALLLSASAFSITPHVDSTHKVHDPEIVLQPTISDDLLYAFKNSKVENSSESPLYILKRDRKVASRFKDEAGNVLEFIALINNKDQVEIVLTSDFSLPANFHTAVVMRSNEERRDQGSAICTTCNTHKKQINHNLLSNSIDFHTKCTTLSGVEEFFTRIGRLEAQPK